MRIAQHRMSFPTAAREIKEITREIATGSTRRVSTGAS
jgi:hypothetical protein